MLFTWVSWACMSALAASCPPPADPVTGLRHPAPDPNPDPLVRGSDPEPDLYKNVTDLATLLSRTTCFCLVLYTVPPLKKRHFSVLFTWVSWACMSALAASCPPPADPATGWRHPAPGRSSRPARSPGSIEQTLRWKVWKLLFPSVFRIHMVLGLPDPGLLARGTVPDPDPSII